MLGLRRKPRFDPDTLSSIWVMACRDESPVLTAYSVAYRLGGIAPKEVMELVKGRRELFRPGLTRGQSRGWKNQYRPPEPGTEPPEGGEKNGKPDDAPKRMALPDWLQAFDDEAPEGEQQRVRDWLQDRSITSSRQALDHFLDDRFVVDETAFRSQFRIDRDLKAEPSDLATVNWGLEHIERLRRGRAETRQSIVALTTGLGGVAIGAMVALTAPIVTTLYQGAPADTARETIDHQTLLDRYGALGTAVAGADRAARSGDRQALAAALVQIETATTTLALLLDPATRTTLRQQESRAADACVPASGPAPPTCAEALRELQRLIDGPLAEVTSR
jgi:hypothetical protein